MIVLALSIIRTNYMLVTGERNCGAYVFVVEFGHYGMREIE